jgi:hypothetical protein
VKYLTLSLQEGNVRESPNGLPISDLMSPLLIMRSGLHLIKILFACRESTLRHTVNVLCSKSELMPFKPVIRNYPQYLCTFSGVTPAASWSLIVILSHSSGFSFANSHGFIHLLIGPGSSQSFGHKE